MKPFYWYIVFALSYAGYGQVTNIPDANFEQALIDLGIDSDGIINGQVLTSDIVSVTILPISDKFILDLTGIEDFTALETLECGFNSLTSLDLSGNPNLSTLRCDFNELTSLDLSANSQLRVLNCSQNGLTSIDVSSNVLLEELYCGNPQNDTVPQNFFTEIDVSSNSLLTLLSAEFITSLTFINAKNGNNNALQNVFAPDNAKLFCVQVDDEVAATNGNPPYGNWTIPIHTVFSEDCSLGTDNHTLQTAILYPNPVYHRLYLDAPYDLSEANYQVFSPVGVLVMEGTWESGFIDVSSVLSGLYFLYMRKDQRRAVKTFIKR